MSARPTVAGIIDDAHHAADLLDKLGHHADARAVRRLCRSRAIVRGHAQAAEIDRIRARYRAGPAGAAQ